MHFRLSDVDSGYLRKDLLELLQTHQVFFLRYNKNCTPPFEEWESTQRFNRGRDMKTLRNMACTYSDENQMGINDFLSSEVIGIVGHIL